jgi:FecR-like protein
MRYPVLAVFVVVCSLLANGCWKGINLSTAATVLSVKSKVAFGSAERNNFQPVTLKSRIHDNDTVRSSYGASIDLALIPGAFAQLAGDSEIKIEELRIAKDGNQTAGGMRDRSARIRLSRGRIIVLFSPSDRSASQFAIKVRQLTIKPDSACLFSVRTDRTRQVTCAKGEVKVSTDDQPPVTIAAGYFQKWPTTGTKPLAAADDATAQIDVTESLEAGERLQEQASAWPNRHPF